MLKFQMEWLTGKDNIQEELTRFPRLIGNHNCITFKKNKVNY